MIQSISEILLGNVIDRLEKKPVLVIHFLVYLSLASFLYCLLRTVIHIEATTRLTLSTLVLAASSSIYASWWNRLIEKAQEMAIQVFDKIISNMEQFIEIIINKHIYDFIELEKVNKLSSLKLILPHYLSYCLMWMGGIYAVDALVYILSGISVLQHMCQYYHIPLLLAFTLSQFVEPWQDNKPTEDKAESGQYLQEVLSRFFSFEGLIARLKSRASTAHRLAKFTDVLPPLMRFFVNLLRTPAVPGAGAPYHVDWFSVQIPRQLRQEDKTSPLPLSIGGYYLEPLGNKTRCNSIPQIRAASLRGFCWYKVYRKEGEIKEMKEELKKGEKKEEKEEEKKEEEKELIGFAMMAAVSAEKPSLISRLERCLKDKQISNVIRAFSCLYGLIMGAVNRGEVEDHYTLIVLVVGTEKILGFKYQLYASLEEAARLIKS